MSVRTRRRLLALAHVGLISVVVYLVLGIALLLDDPETLNAPAIMLLGYVLTLRWNPLPRWVIQRLIREARCPECGQGVDLVNLWHCGCGYVIWHPRHALSPCPNCGKVFAWLVCPRCEASILI